MSEPVKKPIFRWAGGKSWLLKYLHKYLPDDYKNYHEPFLGGASVFFHLRSEKTSATVLLQTQPQAVKSLLLNPLFEQKVNL